MRDTILRHMLDVWGSQWRRIVLGGRWVRDSDGVMRQHVDGYPTTSLSAFADHVGRGTGGDRSLPEVYTGHGLTIHRGLQRLHEPARISITISYGIRTPAGRVYPARERAEFMGIGPRRFWEIMGEAELQLSGYVAGFDDAKTVVHTSETAKQATLR